MNCYQWSFLVKHLQKSLLTVIGIPKVHRSNQTCCILILRSTPEPLCQGSIHRFYDYIIIYSILKSLKQINKFNLISSNIFFRINTPRTQGGLGKMKIPLLADLTKQISKDYGVLLEDLGHTLR